MGRKERGRGGGGEGGRGEGKEEYTLGTKLQKRAYDLQLGVLIVKRLLLEQRTDIERLLNTALVT